MRISALLAAAVVVAFSTFGSAHAAESIEAITTTPLRAGSPGPFGKSMAMRGMKSASGDVALAAAAWLGGQQKDALHASPGAFPWTADDVSVFSNTQGATSLGLVRAYQRTGEPSILATAVANGGCIIADCISGMTYGDGDHRFATHDPLFLVELSNASGDPVYANFVQAQMWDKFLADGGNGEYGATDDLNAAEFADAVFNGRNGGGIPELASWDLAKMVIAAHVAGQTTIRDAMMPRILDSLQAADGSHDTYDVIGLAGALWVAATVGVELDPVGGTWDSANDNAGLAAALLARQASNGGFIAGNAQPVIDAEADAQTTAFAMQALAALDRDLYADEINAGFAFIASLQQGNGQFLSFAGASPTIAGGVESHGETLEAFSVLQLGPDRYVSKTGADAGSCSTPSSACLTIQYAVDQAFEGDSIHIDSGSYDETVTVTTNGLQFIGEGVTPPQLTMSSGATNQSLLTVDGATDVSFDNLHFIVDVSYVGEGLLCRDGCTRISVQNSEFIQSQSIDGVRSSYGRTNAISAGLVGSHPVPIEIAVSGTDIAGDPGSAFPTQFRAGIALDYGFGVIGGPNPGDGNDIVSINHDVIVRQHEGGDLHIEGNSFRGFGVQYTTPLATAGAVDIVDNQFQPLLPPDSPAPAGDFSAMRLISNANGVLVNVSGNSFDGHERGLLIENFPGVTLAGNSFTPKAGSSSFSHVVISNKELFTNNPPPSPLGQSLALTATGNTFNAGSIAGTGTAIELLNDNAQGEPVGGYYGAVAFGGMGTENDFVGDFGRVFQLDDFSCADSNLAPCPLAPLYATAIGMTANTPVVPYAGDVSAINNRFDGVLPAGMSPAQRSMLLARTQDDGGDPNLGHVDYGFTAGPDVVYVDDDYVGDGYGDSHVFVHSDGSANGQTVYFGIDAFASIADAISAVAEDGTIYVADGNYAETVVVAKRLDFIGDGSTATTTINGSLVITASGVDDMNPLLFSGFVVSNPAGDGLRLNSSVAHLQFNGVAFDGNSGHGVNFNAIGIDDVHFTGTGTDCRFNNNGSMGIRTGSSAVTSNIGIDNCDFNGNVAGIVMFGGSGGGNGQLTDWTIDNSRFVGNDGADTTVWGGGIWIKTAGAGSLIDGVLVSNSTFRDNGSSNVLNRTGLTIRARPDTTLQNIQVCDNLFEDTLAPGTQAFGVHLFDDTATGGSYQPIEICGSNVFTGLDASVSGIEQFNVRGTEPTVVVTGDPLTGWEHLDFGAMPVVYVDDDFVGSINGASVAFVGNPAAACAAAAATYGIDAFASIGEALQHVSGGGNVCVAEGFYVEGDTMAGTNLAISSPVSMHGAQSGIDARNRADAGASIVVPAHANPALDLDPNGTFASLVDIFADDVTVDGFVFDGDNPAINTGLGMGSADPDIDGGMQIGGERIDIRNNVVRNLVYSGIEAYRYPLSEPVSEGNAIHRNWVHNIDAPSNWGIGVITHYNYYAAVTENLVEDVRIGFQTGNHTKAIANPATDALIADNTFEASATGIYHNAQYTNASPFTFSGNAITANANPAQDGLWIGFALGALNDATTATVQGNDIDGSALSGSGRDTAGYRSSLISTSMASSVSIDGGTVGNVDFGVMATDGAYFPGAQDDVVVQNVAFSDIGTAALWVEDTALAGAETVDNSPRLTVGNGNSFTNVPHEGALSGPLARIEFTGGAPLLQTLLVRAAGNGHRGAAADFYGNVRSVDPGIVNDAIADTAIGGTVTLEAGDFAQNVVLNKSVTVQGPFVGTPGHDAGRDGTGEASIQPASGTTLIFAAPDAVAQGLTIQGSIGGGTAIRVGNASADNIRLADSRVINVTNGSGIESEIGSNCAVDGVDVMSNLFQGISGGGAANGRGVRLGNGHCNVQIVDNAFDTMLYAVNLNGGGSDTLQNLTITDNRVQNTTGTAFVLTSTSGTLIQRNTVGASAGGLFFSDKTSNLSASCNILSATGNGISTFDFFGGIPNVNVRIFDNAISGAGSDLNSSIAQGLIVGSNWYDGAPPQLNPGAVNLLVADPLAADPTNGGAFDVAACGDNTATAVVVYAGSPQTAPVNTAFGDLSARVVDALGGAVPDAPVDFMAPVSGASANLATASGTADYNGVWTTAATANGTPGGPYNVVASSGASSVDFVLTNARGVTTIELVQSDFDYTNADITLAARLVDEPGTSCGPLSPATIRDVGTYSIGVGACSGVAYDAPAATLTATVGPGKTVHVVETDEYFNTVAEAQNDPDTSDGDTVELAPGIYSGPVTIIRPITLRGGGTFTPSDAGTTPPGPVTVIDGADASNDGITIASGVEDVVITGLEIRNFLRHCVTAPNGNHGLLVQENLIHDCGGRGISISGINAAGINDVTIDHNEVHTTGDRGIVVWDGIKRDITITNNWVHDLDFSISGGSGCCGIELQDGAATGAVVTDNLVENTRDSGMAFIQLTSGSPSSRPNVIARNIVRNTGRFGIEIKIPNGTGLDSGDGAIIVEDNQIDGFGIQSLRDRAGIAVHRRSFGSYPFQVDATAGVMLRGNTVSGFRTDTAGYEGYGIVVEGIGSSVFGNTLSDNDIGLQVQQANPSYPGDSDQNAMDDWFGRGNAQLTCAAIGSNDFGAGIANSIDQRSQPTLDDLIQGVHNETADTWHCTIQGAIDAANDLPADSDTIRAYPGTYAEGVLINKSVTVVGPFDGVPGDDVSRDGTGEAVIDAPALSNTRAVRIGADDVTVDGITITGLYGAAGDVGLASGGNYGASGNDAIVRNNRFVDLQGSAIFTNGPTNLSGWTVQDNLFDGIVGPTFSAINLWKMDGALISGNVIRDIGYGGIQLNTNTAFQVLDNQVSDTGASGINVGPAVDGVQVNGNVLSNVNADGSNTQGALIVYGTSSNIEITCNTLEVSAGNALLARADGSFGPLGNAISIFHNAVTGSGVGVENGNSGLFTVGSNWYGGGMPVTANSGGGVLQVANPLPVDPIGDGSCGLNAPVSLDIVSGSPQSTVVGQAFGDDLTMRVTDALGGAVPAIDVDFAVPGAGASAVLGSASGVTDFNGVVSTGATANTIAGNYVVNADLNPATGSPLGFDLTNLAGALASLSEVSGNGQNGIAGLALADPLVVLAQDGFGNPVPGAPIGFAVTAGAGSIAGASTVTNVFGLASSGDWTLGRDAGSNSAEASVSGNGSITPVAFTATGSEQADIAISKSSTQSTVEPGETVDYLLSVTNSGPSNATAVDVLDALPAELDIATASWICVASSGAGCAGTNGMGNVSLSGNIIPVGGSISVLLSADVLPATQNGVFTNTAMAELTSGDDPNAANDVDDRDVEVINATPLDPDIFKDGFEGEAVPFAPTGSGSLVKLAPDWGQVVDAATPVRLLSMPDERGKLGIELIAFRSDGQLWLRLGGRDAAGKYQRSRWMQVAAGELSLGWQPGKSATRFDLTAGDRSLDITLHGDWMPATIKTGAGSTIH